MSASAGGSLSARPSVFRYAGVMDSAMESPMASWNPSLAPLLKEKGLLVVGALIEVVAQLVMHRGEVVGADLDAHLHAQVVGEIDVPCRGMADDLTIARMHELRALPERLRAAERIRAT